MTPPGRLHQAIDEQNDVEVARRSARVLAHELHFDRIEAEAIALTVSELATNLLRYATGGKIDVVGVDGPRGAGIEIESRDQGPGIRDLGEAVTDGYSSGGGLGSGLGSAKRLMDEFELTSSPTGTIVVCRKWRQKI
jgi:serine/threonine-protein kinase RsbT